MKRQEFKYVPKTSADIKRQLMMGPVWHFVDAWFIMLILGAVHSHQSVVPAFGYWVTFALMFVFRFAEGNTLFLHPWKIKKFEV